jgi:hypothetical protein
MAQDGPLCNKFRSGSEWMGRELSAFNEDLKTGSVKLKRQGITCSWIAETTQSHLPNSRGK